MNSLSFSVSVNNEFGLKFPFVEKSEKYSQIIVCRSSVFSASRQSEDKIHLIQSSLICICLSLDLGQGLFAIYLKQCLFVNARMHGYKWLLIAGICSSFSINN